MIETDAGGGPAAPEGDGCAAVAHLTRDAAAVITSVDDAIRDVLGWTPDEMVGHPSTGFIHPEDQPSAVATWFEMRDNPHSCVVWRGRYRTASGNWQWVETENTNDLDDSKDPAVHTRMRVFTGPQVSMAEELRARKQLLNMLSDAVPVGIFQLERGIDREVVITFTNDRFLEMFGPVAAATAGAQFTSVLPEDVPHLEDAICRVLADEPVDSVEVRFRPPDDRRLKSFRVGQLSLRPLTDDTGRVTGAIGCVTEVTESVELRRELEIRAAIDGLTGCLNRQATMDLLDATLASTRDEIPNVAVLFIDLDQFKDVNDVYGHSTGDLVLVDVAKRIRRSIRSRDRFGRVGGDEFLVICPDVGTSRIASGVANRVAKALHGSIEIPDATIAFQASVGVAWTDRPATADELVAMADSAMYQSKHEGLGKATLAA